MLRCLKHLIIIIIFVGIITVPLYINFQEEIDNFFHELLTFESKCAINIEDFDDYSPIFLTKDRQFKIPDQEQELKWEDHLETTLVACSGKAKKSLSEVSCHSTHKFRDISTKKFVNAREFLNCSEPVESSVRKNLKNIRNFQVGFEIGNEDWITLFEVVYVGSEEKENYTGHYTLHDFQKVIGNYNNVTMNNTYLKYDESGFSESEIKTAYVDLNKEYEGTTHKLIPGFLTPPEDMIFKTWQKATNYLVNTEPMFESIKNGNWKAVEDLVRKNVAHHKRATVYTGVLALNNRENSMLRVPKYFWKILKVAESGIAFITLNDPEGEQNMDKFGCKNLCEEHHWIITDRNNVELGKTICCNVTQFIESNENIPNQMVVYRILDGQQ